MLNDLHKKLVCRVIAEHGFDGGQRENEKSFVHISKQLGIIIMGMFHSPKELRSVEGYRSEDQMYTKHTKYQEDLYEDRMRVHTFCIAQTHEGKCSSNM